jgi:hypothetical protein
VVNNAGNSTLGTIVNLFEDDWNLLVDTHLTHAVAHSLSERAMFYDPVKRPGRFLSELPTASCCDHRENPRIGVRDAPRDESSAHGRSD